MCLIASSSAVFGCNECCSKKHESTNKRSVSSQNLSIMMPERLLSLLFILFFSANLLNAQVTKTAGTGDWNTSGTWSPSGVPQSNDLVIIGTGATVTVTADATCGTLTFLAATGTSTLRINTGISLSVSGAITIPRATNPGLNTISVGAGNLNAGSIAFTNGGNNVRHSITISTGIVSVTGDVTTTGTGSASIIFSGSGTLNVGGAFYTTGTGTLTTVSGSTVNYNKAGNQSIGVFAYNNLTLSGSGTKTFVAVANIAGNLAIDGSAVANLGTFGSTSSALYLGGVLQNVGSWGSTSSNAQFKNNTWFAATTGTVTIVSGVNTWNGSVDTDWNIAGNWSLNTIPTPIHQVVIPNVTNKPVIGTGGGSCFSVTISTGSYLTISASNILTVSGDWTNSGTFIPNTSSVIFNGTIQNVGAGPFYDVTLSGVANITTGAAIVIGGDLTVGTGTTFTTGATNTWTLGVSGTTTISGTLRLANTGAKTFTGEVILNSGATWNESDAASISFGGNFTNNATSFTASTGTHTFSGTTKTIGGATENLIPRATFTGAYTSSGTLTVATTLTVSGVTLTNDGTITATTALSGTGGLIQGATGVLNLGGTSAISTLNATSSGNIVKYSGTAQTAKVTTYHHLTLSGSSSKTFASTPSVNGILSMEGTATITVTGAGVVTYGTNATLQYNSISPRTTSSEEWISPFAATGGVVIANKGLITMNSSKVLSASVPLTINSGASLSTNSFSLTFGGNFVNNGTFTAGSSQIIITNTSTQSISGFTTTGLVSMTKTSGTATFGGNVVGSGLTINGTGGELNLGVSKTHTFSGVIALTAGTLNGGSSTLNLSATGTVVTGTGTNFTAGTGTVNYTRAGTQTVGRLTYNNLILSGSGTKTTTSITVNGTLSMEGTATASATPTYEVSAALQYKGSAAQITGAEFPASFSATGGVKIENSYGVTLNAIRTISASSLTIGNVVPNSIFRDGGFQLTITGTTPLNLTSGTLKLGAATATTFPAFTTRNISAGTIVEYAATATQTVKGMTYSNLTISGSGTNSKTVDSDVTVDGILNLISLNASATQGCLNMGSYTLNMGETATTTGTGDVTGIVKRTQTFVNNTAYSFGNKFTTLTFLGVSGSAKPGWVSCKISVGAAPTWRNVAVRRVYTFAQEGSGTDQVIVNLHYLDSELNTASQTPFEPDETKLVLWDGHGGTPWSTNHPHGKSNNSTINNWISLTGLTINYLAPSTSLDISQVGLSYSNVTKNIWTGGANSTDWGDAGNWDTGVPLTSHEVLISSGRSFYPVLTAAVEVKTMEIETGASVSAGANTITINGSTGAWINIGTFTAGTGTVIFSHGLVTDVISILGTTNFYNVTVSSTAFLQPQTGSIMRIAGTVTQEAGSIIDLKNTSNTVEYIGSGQSILNFQGPASSTGYYNLTVNSSGTTTLPAVLNVANDFTLTAGTTNAASSSIIDVLGNLILTAGTFTGSDAAISVKGNWTNNGASFTASTSTVTFNNNSAGQEINGTASSQTFYNIIVNKSSQTLSVGGNTTSLTLENFTETSGNFTATATLTINGNANLTAGTLTAGSTTTTISGTTTLTAGTYIAGITTNLTGNWTNNGATFTAGSGTVNFSGSAAQSISGSHTFNNLTVNNSAGVTANANQTVTGILNLQSANASSIQGCLNMSGSYELTMGASATTTGTGDVTGIVKRTSFEPNTPYSFGNQFTTINLTTEGTLPASVSIKIILTATHSWKTDAINRYYDIIQTGCDEASRLALNLHYLDGELNGAIENSLDFFDYHISETLVHDHGRSNSNTANNWVGLSNLGMFFVAGSSFDQHYWTLGTNNTGNTSIWEGGSVSGPTDWTLPGNWDGGVPTATSIVIIPAVDLANVPVLSSNDTIGSITIQSGGILTASGNPVLTITGGGGAWNNLGTFNPGTSTVEFTNPAATMADPTNFYNVTVADGAILTLGTDNIMRIGGTLSLSNNGVLNAANNHNTVEFNGGSQTVILPNGATPGYHNLILSGSGIKIMPASLLLIGMDLTLSGTVSVTASQDIAVTGNVTIGSGTTLSASSHSISSGGNWSNSGTFTAGTGTVLFTGVDPQTLNGSTTFNNLTISGAAGVTAGADQTVNGILNLANANPSSTKGLLEMTISYGTYPGTTKTVYLNSWLLNMGANATTTGTGDVTGTIKRSTILANTPYSFGHQYTTISFTTGTMPSDVSVSVVIGVTPQGKPDAIKRMYEIMPAANGSNCYVTANFHYLDSELQSSVSPNFTNTESKMVTWDYDIEGPGIIPDEHGRSDYNFSENYVGLSNIPISYFIKTTGHDWRTIFTLGDYAVGYYTWNGSTNTDWGTSTNWTPVGSPSGLSHIIIPDAGTTPNDPELPAGSVAVNTLLIEDGGVLVMGSNTLVIENSLSGGWEDQNQFGNDPGASTVIFSRPGTTISGNAWFNNVQIAAIDAVVDTIADITNQPGSTMKIKGTVTRTGLGSGKWYADVFGATIEYSGGSQTVMLPDGTPNYHNLVLSGTGTKTLPASAMSIHNDITLNDNVTAAAGAALNIAGNIIIGSGTTFTAGTYTHTITGNWTNSGTFTPGTGTIVFNGSLAQTMSGSNTFNNLTINGAGGVTSDADQTVNGILDLISANPSATKGALDMVNNWNDYPATSPAAALYTLTMGSSATTTGIGDVTGMVKRITPSANTAYTYGNQYSTINLSSATPSEILVVIRIGVVPSGKTNGIIRSYEIIPTGGSGGTVAANLHYLDSELNGNTENKLVNWDYDIDGGSATPDEHSRAVFDLTNNYIGMDNVPYAYLVPGYRTIYTLGDFSSASYVWNGTVSTIWGTTANWTPAGNPDQGVNDITLPGGTPNDPVLPSGTTTVNSVTIANGGILIMGGNTLNILAGWTDNNITTGNDPGTSTVVFQNSGATIEGNTRFYNIEIGTGADITNQLNSKMKVEGNVTATGTWNAFLFNNTVDYGASGAQIVAPAIYSNLTLSGSGIKTTSGVNVYGILSMEGTATVSASPFYGTTAALQYNTATARSKGLEWITPFTATGGIIIANTGKITVDETRVMNAFSPLTINSGAQLEISSGVTVTVSGTLTNNGGYSGLVLKSTSPNVDGKLINNTASVDATVELMVTGGFTGSSAGIFHFFVPPVESMSIYTLLSSAMADTRTSLGLTFDNFKGDLTSYSESSAGTNQDKGWQYFDGWIPTNSGYAYAPFSSLVSTQGYDIHLKEATGKITFSGALNAAQHSFTLNRSANCLGWNLVGNPYPCNYNLSGNTTFTTPDNGVDKNLYITKDGDYVYKIVDGAGIGWTNDIIPPMQGFFVHVTTPGNTLVLPVASKTATEGEVRAKGAVGLKSSKGILNKSIRLLLNNSTGYDEALVYFNEKATSGFDSDFDAYKLFGSNPAKPYIYSELNSVKYAINCLSDPGYEVVRIPFSVVLKSQGTYNIDIPEFENFDGVKVVLRHGAIETVLSKNVSYSFTSAAGTFTDFELVIGSIVTSIEEIVIEKPYDDRIKSWYSNNFLYINCATEILPGDSNLTIFDMQGKPVYSYAHLSSSPGQTIQLPLSLPKGVYATKVTCRNQSFVTKIVVF